MIQLDIQLFNFRIRTKLALENINNIQKEKKTHKTTKKQKITLNINLAFVSLSITSVKIVASV